MNYTEAVAYIHSLGRFSGTPSLDRMVSFLKRIGNPEKTLQIVHVGGTNGKGSTCAMLASIMRASGRKTGLYTSPYLDSFTNRFRIDGEDISQSEIAEMATSFRPLAEEEKLTQFEFITAIAFAFYAQKKVDILILEVGLGGRFDATNVVSPLCSVITNIGYDHMEVLGNTLEKIAFEKAGIIKPCVPVVCGVEDLGPYTVIADVARERVAPIKLLNRDFSYLKEAHSLGG
ncbi:MAG: Mur ligase family protein, partial [bacterium]|nr:Mur ligase family protein [bacterium]